MMPNAIEAERAFLGSLFFGDDLITDLEPRLRPEDFYRPEHSRIYRAALGLYEKSEPIDVITLAEELKRQGEKVEDGVLADVASAAGTSVNAATLSAIIRDKALRRRILATAEEIKNAALACEDGAGEVLDRAEGLIHQLGDENAQEATESVKNLAKRALDKIESLKTSKGLVGFDTGFTDLNRLTAGLQRKDLVIVAGRPSMGKTAFALNLALNVAKYSREGTAIFSLEMSNDSLALRMLAAMSRVSLGRIRTGACDGRDWKALVKATSALSKANIICDESSSLSPLELRARARRIVKKHKVGMIIVDYLQLMRGESSRWENREREIGDISRSLKALAKELDLPVVALSQLNRNLESRDDKRPKLSDLRESGSIEQDADLVLFLYRDEVYRRNSEDEGVAEIIIGKQRNGPLGTARLRFFNEFGLFENLEEQRREPWPDATDRKSLGAGEIHEGAQ